MWPTSLDNQDPFLIRTAGNGTDTATTVELESHSQAGSAKQQPNITLSEDQLMPHGKINFLPFGVIPKNHIWYFSNIFAMKIILGTKKTLDILFRPSADALW